MSQLGRLTALLGARVDILMDHVERAPSWVQVAWAFAMLASIGAVVGHLWYAPLGTVLVATLVLLIAATVVGRWRWGLVVFITLAGAIWVTQARHPAAAALVSIASLVLGSLLTLPRPVRTPTRATAPATSLDMSNALRIAPTESFAMERSSLHPALAMRVLFVHRVFSEVLPSSLESAIANFEADADPDSELVLWERAAFAYLQFTSRRTLSFAQRQHAFKVASAWLLSIPSSPGDLSASDMAALEDLLQRPTAASGAQP